jgi:hypothetical protein
MTRLLRLVAVPAAALVVLGLTTAAFASSAGHGPTLRSGPSLAASGGLGSPFATGSGVCDPTVGYATFQAPISASHPDPIAELSANGLAILGNPFAKYEYTGGAGSVWEPYPGSLSAGDNVNIEIDCITSPSDVSYTISLYDAPSTPFTVSGAVTDTPCNPSCYPTSDVRFSTPAYAHYVADWTITQGSLESNLPSPGSGSGRGDLGYLYAGQYDLVVNPLAGPTADWSVSIHALPVILSALRFATPWIAPGQNAGISYHIDGDATLTATIKNSSGVVVRTLASNLAVAHGDHTLTWNGLNASASPVPDGTYTVAVNYTDYAGNTGSGQASIEVDATPPVITAVSGSTIASSGDLIIDVADALSGLDRADLRIDGGTTPVLSTSGSQLVYAPGGGWLTGKHTWQVTARDKVGNTSTATGSFTTPPGCRVPRVIGRGLETAKHAIVQAGCSVGTISRKASSKRQEGHVLSQKPPPGSLLQKGAPLSLWVGSGPGHSKVKKRKAPRGDWSNPYPLGTTVTSDNWKLRVLGGPINADAVMEGAGSPPPPAGTQYALVHVVLSNEASTTQDLRQFLIGGPMVVEGNKTRIPYFAQPTGAGWPIHYLNLMDIGSTGSGETVTGYLSYLIKSDDARTLKLLLPGRRNVWLALH